MDETPIRDLPLEDQIRRYQDTVAAVARLGGVISLLPVDQILEAIQAADTAAPILDPTLWRSKRTAMYEDRDLLQAALPLWQKIRELKRLEKARLDAQRYRAGRVVLEGPPS